MRRKYATSAALVDNRVLVLTRQSRVKAYLASNWQLKLIKSSIVVLLRNFSMNRFPLNFKDKELLGSLNENYEDWLNLMDKQTTTRIAFRFEASPFLENPWRLHLYLF